MTQFYVPWAERNPQVVGSVPPGTIWVDVSAGLDSYWDALRQIWSKGQDFAIIEHDVVIHGDVVRQFAECPEPWCTFGYANICHPECQEAWANQLGCTRFRAELIEACPAALISIPPERRDWHNVCDEIAGNKIGGVDQPVLRPHSLRTAGFTHHWHSPPVDHHPWFACR